mmetsp:Transcript_24110/g.50468  ORF Transcript_24110/g.50468 Transcript_24110/m.50468 type:complete len:172 (-) Transcript_24110:422-937(-)
MCGICILGFCIPYAAILPMLIIGLQWVVHQFNKIGIELPAFVSKQLGLAVAGQKKPQQANNTSWCDRGWCLCKKFSSIDRVATMMAVTMPNDDGVRDVGHITKQKSPRRCDSQGSFPDATTTSDDDESEEKEGQLILASEMRNLTQLNGEKSPPTTVWWCQPCNEIQTETG